MLGSGLSDYRRSVQLWWQRLDAYDAFELGERPVYFVSSNTHSLTNLFSGFVRQEGQQIIDLIERERPEGLHEEYRRLLAEAPGQVGNLLYYASRFYLSHGQLGRQAQARFAEAEAGVGLQRMRDPHCLDVEAQVLEVSKLRTEWLDPRLGNFSAEEIALLKASDALILNIDYPLGMAAYHIFSQVSTAVSDLLGVYIIGKAATLNGRVGDVMIPNVVYDEHSQNTFLFRNCFTAVDVAPYLRYGTVFDNQKSVTVRGTFLQNRNFMHVFYEESYTDIEMEAGPYLSAIYEDIYPKRHPLNEIVNIFINAPYDIGVLHYASDTPISRRQTLLSKSLSYMGVDATYATTIPVARRILRQEIDRQSGLAKARLAQGPGAEQTGAAQRPTTCVTSSGNWTHRRPSPNGWPCTSVAWSMKMWMWPTIWPRWMPWLTRLKIVCCRVWLAAIWPTPCSTSWASRWAFRAIWAITTIRATAFSIWSSSDGGVCPSPSACSIWPWPGAWASAWTGWASPPTLCCATRTRPVAGCSIPSIALRCRKTKPLATSPASFISTSNSIRR